LISGLIITNKSLALFIKRSYNGLLRSDRDYVVACLTR